MVALLVIFMIVAFITADVLVRIASQKIQESKARKKREQALDMGLRLDYTDEATSLKRVEVDEPKARILAVDDEAVVLDSFRKILVLAGYNVDTVETGQEAVGLVRKNDYDFVFVDLKMPEMDGIEVTKAVKHLRPDIDVVIITGYATVESAVETMKYGALDYVQKPFTEEELVEAVDTWVIRRQDRLEKQMKPKVHLVTPTSEESQSEHVFNVPAGIFISPEHTWISIEMNGAVKIGIDDFAQKTIGQIAGIEFPQKGKKVKKGDALFTIRQNGRTLTFPSPVTGEVSQVHLELSDHVDLLKVKPYEVGWICTVEPTDLTKELQSLKIGASAVSWYHEEIDKFRNMVKQLSETRGSRGNGKLKQESLETMDDKVWEAFSKSFLHA